LERVEVGNAYVNRHTTGAIVRRQPFGGWKRSSVGRGAKSGGPGDVDRFVTFRRRGDRPSLDAARASYRRAWAEQFGVAIDRSGLRSERNVLRYRPVGAVIVRVGADTPAADLASLRAAADVTGVAMDVSGPAEDDVALAGRLPTSGAARLRVLTDVDEAVLVACHDAGIAVDWTPVTHDGRVELPCWLREQSISWTLHRHGRIPGHHGQP